MRRRWQRQRPTSASTRTLSPGVDLCGLPDGMARSPVPSLDWSQGRWLGPRRQTFSFRASAFRWFHTASRALPRQGPLILVGHLRPAGICPVYVPLSARPRAQKVDSVMNRKPGLPGAASQLLRHSPCLRSKRQPGSLSPSTSRRPLALPCGLRCMQLARQGRRQGFDP